MNDVLHECESMRQTFRHWHAEQESLEAQLSESLAALSAYQSHLDAWQQQLAGEREELRKARELGANDRPEPHAELEQARAREKELESALEEQKRILESERAQWAETLKQQQGGGQQGQSSSASDAPAGHKPAPIEESPVLGSLMEQFGKLSQQRAIERQALKKTSR